jgi:hypothetical protein
VVAVLGCSGADVEPAEAGVAAAALEAAEKLARTRAKAREDAIPVLVRAAEMYVTGQVVRYDDVEIQEAAGLMLDERPPGIGPAVVARALARAHDQRAEDALMRWAEKAATKYGAQEEVIEQMSANPSPRYLLTVRVLLADPAGAARLARAPWLRGYDELLVGVVSTTSLHSSALGLAAGIDDEPSRELLRSVATDRSIPTPDPRIIKALRCRWGASWPGELRDEGAMAVASLRFVALALLGDQDLMRAVARDSEEPEFLRDLALKMSAISPEPPRRPSTATDSVGLGGICPIQHLRHAGGPDL